jgi:hypothetical protein
MGESRVRKQASTLPARVLATLASTLPSLTSTNDTLMGLGRVNHHKVVPTQAIINIKIIIRRIRLIYEFVCSVLETCYWSL